MGVVNMNVPEKILLVIKDEKWKDGIEAKQAYVVDPTNKKQLENARSWGKVHKVGIFGQRLQLEPLEIYTDNHGFKLTLVDNAGVSSQGGKLSFWNCLIEKGEDIKVIIGIDQNNLLSVLKQSVTINGTIQENLSLSKLSSTSGVIHDKMEEWKTSSRGAKADLEGAKKTTKWEQGIVYRSKTKETICIAKLFYWFDEKTEIIEENNLDRHIYSSSSKVQVTHTHLKLRETPIECYGTMAFEVKYDELNKNIREHNITKLSEVFDFILKKLDTIGAKNSTYYLNECIPFFKYKEHIVEKFPSRICGEQILVVDDATDKLNMALELYTEKALKLWGDTSVYPDSISKAFGYSAYIDKKPSFTEEQKEMLLNKASRTVHFDFGDGIEQSGRRR